MTSAKEDPGLPQAMSLIALLAEEIGPRRPCSEAEAEAAERLRAGLAANGVEARIEPFRSLSTFGLPVGMLAGAGVLAGIVPRRYSVARSVVAVVAGLGAAYEGSFSRYGAARLLARQTSRNLVAEIDAGGSADRTLCLVSHLDSSRSGLIFHPSVTPYLGKLVAGMGAAVLIQAGEPVLGRSAIGRRFLTAARAGLALTLAALAEREIRGVDVSGANDNASGAAVTAALASELASSPLESTRVVLLITGSEESGLLGMRHFLGAHDTTDWLFLNFDGVGSAAAMHFLRREGGELHSWGADPGMIRAAQDLSERRPDLSLTGTNRSSGLPYDSTPVLAGGGRALTISVQDRTIPDYHAPTDTVDRIDPDVVRRALETGRELIRAIDRGEADLA